MVKNTRFFVRDRFLPLHHEPAKDQELHQKFSVRGNGERCDYVDPIRHATVRGGDHAVGDHLHQLWDPAYRHPRSQPMGRSDEISNTITSTVLTGPTFRLNDGAFPNREHGG